MEFKIISSEDGKTEIINFATINRIIMSGNYPVDEEYDCDLYFSDGRIRSCRFKRQFFDDMLGVQDNRVLQTKIKKKDA